MEEVQSLEGLVLKVNGQLVLMIPLLAGGYDLIECSRGISEVQGEFLKIVIPGWLAGMLRIKEGDLICVHNTDGEFRISPANPRLVH